MLTRTIKYLILGLAFYFCHLTLLAQNRNIDSLLTLLKKDKPDTNKVIHSNKLCTEYKNIGLYDNAIYHANAALQLAQQLNFKKEIANSYNNIGNIYSDKGNYPLALEKYSAALKIDEELKNKKGIAGKLNNIGIVYKNQGNYPKALDYYFKALTMTEELGDKNGIATALGNIGLVYTNQADYSKALDYYFKALKMAEELGDKNGIARHIGNIGIVYKEQGDYPKALGYYFNALKIFEEMGDKNKIATALGNIGLVYTYQADYPKALDNYFMALKMAEELGDKNGIARHIGNIGLLYTEQKKYAEAEKYLQEAVKMDKEIGALKGEKLDEEHLTDLYSKTSRYQLALEHYKKAMALKDTIFSQENKKQLVRKEMNYEFDKKEIAAKAEQDKKDAITAEEKQRQKVIIYSISVGLFLVLLLALFIFRGYKQKQKANTIITQQKAEVEKQKELVEKKNKEITDSINYAKRIQQAKLPKKEEIYAALPQSFVLFKPKDIVSGDFYFFKAPPGLPEGEENQRTSQIDGIAGSSSSPSGRIGGTFFIAAADCTGHGVPGAFMSMIGSEKLEDAVSQTTDTCEILSLLNKGIKTALKQTDSLESTRDGMDIALCSVNIENRIVKYAAANRPIYIIRKGQTEVEEIKATKKAIGGFTEDKQHFDTHELKLQQGDTFYIFTDGYADQFGGEEGKKLMTKKFKEILLGIQDRTMQEQEKYLDMFADNWRGNKEQIDDILVIGVRL